MRCVVMQARNISIYVCIITVIMLYIVCISYYDYVPWSRIRVTFALILLIHDSDSWSMIYDSWLRFMIHDSGLRFMTTWVREIVSRPRWRLLYFDICYILCYISDALYVLYKPVCCVCCVNRCVIYVCCILSNRSYLCCITAVCYICGVYLCAIFMFTQSNLYLCYTKLCAIYLCHTK